MTTSTSPTSSGSSADVTSSKSIDRRRHHQRARDRDALLLAARELVRVLARLLREPDDVEELARAQLGLCPGQLPDPPRREREVVDHGQVREEVELLEDDPDPLPDRGDVDALARDLLALEEDAARLDRLEEVDAPQQRALAAAARADHHEHLARLRPRGRCRRGRGCRRSSSARPRAAESGPGAGWASRSRRRVWCSRGSLAVWMPRVDGFRHRMSDSRQRPVGSQVRGHLVSVGRHVYSPPARRQATRSEGAKSRAQGGQIE